MKTDKEHLDEEWEARMRASYNEMSQRQEKLCRLNGWEYEGCRLWTDPYIPRTKELLR